jgi:hypothetical protein
LSALFGATKIGGFVMQGSTSYRRWSVMTLAVMLLAAFFSVPSAVAGSGGGADKAASSAPTQRFLAIGTNPRTDNLVLLGFGPIHAKGVDKPITAHKDVFRFPNGKLIVRHQKVAGNRHHDPATCLFRFFERGTYQVVRGTGDYVGARGHGHYRLHGKFVSCKQDAPPSIFLIVIRAHGPLQL